MLSRGVTKANHALKSAKKMTVAQSNLVKLNHKGFMTINQTHKE